MRNGENIYNLGAIRLQIYLNVKSGQFLKTLKGRHLTGTEIASVYQRLARRALETAVLHSAAAAAGRHRALEPLGPDPRHNHTRQMTDEVMTDPWHHCVM